MPTVHAKARALVAGAALVLAAGVAGVTASPASAATGDLKITNASAGDGSTSGNNFSVPGFTTPAPCSDGTTRHVTKVVDAVATDPADQSAIEGWKGRNMYSPSSVDLPGPLKEYPSSSNMQSWANTYGLQLVAGTWTLETRCQNNLGTTIFDTFTGTMTWDSPTAWHAAVVAVATTTTLTASPTSVTVGGTVTLTATVTAASGPTPTGSVTFSDGGTVLGSADVDGAGRATLSTSTLAVGSHSVTAAFTPSGAFSSSTSAPVLVTVDSATAVATTTTLVASPAAAGEGERVTFTATVASAGGPGSPTGSVTFRDGATVLGTAALSGGTATLATTALAAGTHEVTAAFSDPTAAWGGSASAPVTVTIAVVAKPTTTTLTGAPTTAEVGTGVILSAVVAPGTATGRVRFLDGTTLLGEAVLESGKATITTSTLAVGSHEVRAEYLGADGTFEPSTSSPVTVTIGEKTTTVATTTSFEVSPSGEATEGDEVTMTATVAGAQDAPVGAGTVEFYDGTTLIGTAELTGETAQVSLEVAAAAAGSTAFGTSGLTVGDHQLSARFAGTEVLAASASEVVSLTVLAADGDGDGGGDPADGGDGAGPGSGSSAGELAETGAALTLVGGVGGALVAAGAALVLLARRRGWQPLAG